MTVELFRGQKYKSKSVGIRDDLSLHIVGSSKGATCFCHPTACRGLQFHTNASNMPKQQEWSDPAQKCQNSPGFQKNRLGSLSVAWFKLFHLGQRKNIISSVEISSCQNLIDPSGNIILLSNCHKIDIQVISLPGFQN